MYCDIGDVRAKILMDEVSKGVFLAVNEIIDYINSNKSFKKTGTLMLSEWNKGLNLTLKTGNQPEVFFNSK